MRSRRAAGALAAWLLTTPLPAAPPRVVEVPLQERQVALRLADEGVGAPALRRVAHTARRALPVLERVLGAPLPPRPDIPVHVYPDRRRTGGEVGYLDHEADALRVWVGISDPVLVHELAHLWLRGERFAQMMGPERWAAEGLCHWAARRVLEEVPELSDAAEFHRVLMAETWGALPGWDEPLASYSPAFPVEAAERPRRLAFYGKAYAFFHACERRASAAAVTRAVGDLLSRDRPATTADVLAALARADPRLAGAAAGWVRGGARAAGFPRPPDTLELPRPGPARPPSLAARGPANPELPAGADLLGAGARLTDDALVLRVHTRGPVAGAAHTWSFGVDLDGDDVFDRGIGFGGEGPAWVGRVFGRFEDARWHRWPRARLTRTASGAVLVLPRGAVDLSGTPRLWAYTLEASSGRRLDGVGWLSLEE